MIGQAAGLRAPTDAAANLPMTVMGASLLGSAGSVQRGQRARGQRPRRECLHGDDTGAAAAALGWMFTEWMSRGKPTVLAPRPAPSRASSRSLRPPLRHAMASVIIGGGAGWLATRLATSRRSCGYDDSLDVVAWHGRRPGRGARWRPGSSRPGRQRRGRERPLLRKSRPQLWVQIVAVASTYVLAIVGTVVILRSSTRSRPARQRRGRDGRLDLSQHSETAYSPERVRRVRDASGGLGEPVRAAEGKPRVGALSPRARRGLIHLPVDRKVSGLHITQHRRRSRMTAKDV